MDNPKVIIVLPAYNAEKTLETTLSHLPEPYKSHWRECVILVDDASKDNTVALAESLGFERGKNLFVHSENKGYGGNQKTCYRQALAAGADIAVMLHPDFQYDPTCIPDLVAALAEGQYDAVFGSRLLGGKFLEGGMPKYKFYGNVVLTAMGNMVLETYLSEFHCGLRAYSRKFLETVDFEANSNGFVFDTEMIVQARQHNFSIGEVPIPTRYFDEASQINLWGCVVYTFQIFRALLRYKFAKAK